MPGSPITAQLIADGYGQLTLDQFAFAVPAGSSALATRKGPSGQLIPPFSTPVFAQDMKGAYKTKTITRTWVLFFEQLAKVATSSVARASGLAQLVILAPSIDEEDIQMYGVGSLDANSDPVTFTPTAIVESSRYGNTFSIGDYIVWNDSTNYEINQITGMTSTSLTVQRAEQGNQGHFGSSIGSHTSKAFFRLVTKVFTIALVDGALPGLVQFPWANKCVVAVRSWSVSASGEAGPMSQLNLAGNGCPGWRTMNGAAYTNLGIAGALAVNQRAAYRVGVQAWESIRCVYASVKTPPAGASIKLAVVWIGPDDVEGSRPVGFIERLEIPIGSYRSFLFSSPPDQQQLPYGRGFPPGLLANCGSLAGLTAPVTVGSGAPYVFSPDGEIDIVIEQVGSTTAGADLMVTVQT